MNAENENVSPETNASDTPQLKAKNTPEAEAGEKPESVIEGDNISCCGSCSG